MSYARRACNIGSVYHASVVRGCVPVRPLYIYPPVRSLLATALHPILSITSCFSNTIIQQRSITTTDIARRSCHTHENCMHAEQIIIILYIYFCIFCSMYLVLFSIVLYRTIVTVYTDNIFLYNYLQQMHQIIFLSHVWCFSPAWGKTMQKNHAVSAVKIPLSGSTVRLIPCLTE